MRLALSQFSPGDDKKENLGSLLRWTEKAAESGADLVVFPECSMFMPASMDDFERVVPEAEALDGPFVSALCEAAGRLKISIICNVWEATGSRPYNTSVVIDAQGIQIAYYRKVHLYDAFGTRESDNIRPSDDPEPVVVDISGVSVGVLICYDLRFPEWARAYMDRGADLLVYSTGWPAGPRKDDHWNTMLRSRAIENTVYVAGNGHSPPAGVGGTTLVDPMGGIEGELTNEDGLIVRDIDLDRIARVRKLNPSLKNRVFTTEFSESKK